MVKIGDTDDDDDDEKVKDGDNGHSVIVKSTTVLSQHISFRSRSSSTVVGIVG